MGPVSRRSGRVRDEIPRTTFPRPHLGPEGILVFEDPLRLSYGPNSYHSNIGLCLRTGCPTPPGIWTPEDYPGGEKVKRLLGLWKPNSLLVRLRG